MKPNLHSQHLTHAATWLAAFCLSTASATNVAPVAPSATLTLTQLNGAVSSLMISNAGDQVWTILSSTNPANWTAVDTVKVFNGMFQRGYTNSVGANGFFRAFYDPASQDIASTTANALALPATPFNYSSLILPASFSVNPVLAEDNMPATDITTDAGATLGRVLFYDKRLSTNQTISCSSCHQQTHGFADPRRVSLGFDGSKGTRNAMGLSNARWYQRKHFFWDERANTLEDQTLMPVQNPIEMGMTLDAVTNRLAAEPFYTNLFALAFGTPDITTNRISAALSQFVRSIVTTASRYDIGLSNNFANFTEQENLGRNLFFGRAGNPPPPCAICHGTDNFVPTTTLNNNGLEFPYVDNGVGAITGLAAQNGLFKVPSLRNIELTAPYMHDGRFTNLDQVVEFYNSGIVNNPNLSPPLRAPGGAPLRLNLTTDQKAALVAFLKTLTDASLATNPKFSDPFNYGN
jgi:cytochrome c peroxidase